MTDKKKLAAELLKTHRIKIDNIDRDIIELLRKRYDVINAVSIIKQENNIPAILEDRVDKVRENAVKYAQKLNLDGNVIRKIWSDLIEHSCKTEENYFKQKNK